MMINPLTMMDGGVEMQQQMMMDVMQEDRLTTYHSEDDITYA